MKTISIDVLLKSELLTPEESHFLIKRFKINSHITAQEILELALPAKNRVEALLQSEFLNEGKLRDIACDFAAHTLHIFEAHAPNDYRPHECLTIASLLNTWGLESWEKLQKVIREARPAMLQFEETERVGAFEACRAVLLQGSRDAVRMAREVAVCSQIAAYRNEWENRKSNTEPMVEREKEAAWQLERIAKELR